MVLRCKSRSKAKFIQDLVRPTSNFSDDVLGGAFENDRRLSDDLSEDDMEINSGLDTVLLMVVDVPDSDVLLEDPEDSLQLPAITEDVSKGDCFHIEFRGEVNQKVSLIKEGHHQGIPLQRGHLDSVSLEFDSNFPSKGPASMVLHEDRHSGETGNLGSNRPAHIPFYFSVGGKFTDHMHAQILNLGNVLWGNVGRVNGKGTPFEVGSFGFQECPQIAKGSSQPLVLVQRVATTPFRGRGKDPDIQDDDIEAITDYRTKRFNIDSDHNLLHRSAVKEAGPTTKVASSRAGAVISAKRDEMPAFVGRIPGMPLPEMFCQLQTPPLHEPSEPPRGSDGIKSLIEVVFVNSMGYGKIQKTIAVQEAGHGSSHDQSPVRGVQNRVKHRIHFLKQEFEVFCLHKKPPGGEIVLCNSIVPEGGFVCTAPNQLLHVLLLEKVHSVPFCQFFIKVCRGIPDERRSAESEYGGTSGKWGLTVGSFFRNCLSN